MREKEIEKVLVDGVKKLGGVAFKFVSPGNDGVPDRLIVMPDGRVCFVELKTERGRLSGLQRTQIRRLRALGQYVAVLHGASAVRAFLVDMGLGFAWSAMKAGLWDVEPSGQKGGETDEV